jgi:hypothetical protein
MPIRAKRIEKVIEVREGVRLIGVVYLRKDGAFDALAFGGTQPIEQHSYSAFDSVLEAIEWVKNFNEVNLAN